MPSLIHFTLDPFSRRLRLSLAEYGVPVELIDEEPWGPSPAIFELNPAGTLPVYLEDASTALCGIEAIGEFLEETKSSRVQLIPGDVYERAEVRRVAGWFDGKFYAEVSEPVLTEKVVRRFLRRDKGGGGPDTARVRQAMTRLRDHLDYIAHLADHRTWLAGNELSLADLAAAAHISAVDYFGDIPWTDYPAAKSWYQRVKSRPSFRPLLADTLRGMAPGPHYADLDFLNVSDLRQEIGDKALAEGFGAVRFTRLSPDPGQAERLHQFIEEGRHGTMAWMAETEQRRASPLTLWPEARTAIVLAQSYAQDFDPLPRLEDGQSGVIASYAMNRDYHDFVKGKLKRIGQWLSHRAKTRVKVFLDTAPLMEKPLAQKAGLGWQGKHTNLVSRELGSWFFIGTILTSAEIAPDPAGEDHCGTCRACLDICPTAAFPAPYQLDARRCISYLTIEHDGHIAPEFRSAMGNRIYGCDDCLAACPWNKFAAAAREARLIAREDLRAPRLADLLELDDAAFRAFFTGSPVKRSGRNRFIRNVLIAAGNSGDPLLAPKAEALLADPSPLVRAMAVWALSRLLGEPQFTALRNMHMMREADAAVRREWETA